ncbi:hypothetical protein [Nocardioides sp.]|uniref:hypothetical protein n=1 Tax=Nocardioides sp. TaxID=35761 RepID=UPI002733291B|nr:hypothetical protein [Nocardioides sp.]MDP3890987.1 hypothetical protein [Nocardioides sp.]
MTHGTPERLVHPSKKELEAPGRDLTQVKYGPTADLSEEEKQRVTERLAVPGLAKGAGDGLERLSQYSPDHIDYVRAAERSGRPLTEQEASVKKRAESARPGTNLKGVRAKDASINHVIASGTGQNTLNTSIAQFTGTQSPATQAAAVGRMQMYNRAIAHENLTPEQREAADNRGRLGNDRRVLQEADAPRNAHLRSLLTIMQGQSAPRGESLQLAAEGHLRLAGQPAGRGQQAEPRRADRLRRRGRCAGWDDGSLEAAAGCAPGRASRPR